MHQWILLLIFKLPLPIVERKTGGHMPIRPINAIDAPVAVGGYAQAVETTGTKRRLYISGQIPVAPDGSCPPEFKDQATLVWQNVEAQLKAANMGISDLVKVTIFLSDRKYALENRDVRQSVLGAHTPAMTVIITGIFDAAWLLEIEAIAEC
jgi:2-iminobutanoate/2-iminopropanoate deaminase